MYPGQKICVNSSGIFDICERVNGHNSIGNVEQGIDGKAVLKIMKNIIISFGLMNK